MLAKIQNILDRDFFCSPTKKYVFEVAQKMMKNIEKSMLFQPTSSGKTKIFVEKIEKTKIRELWAAFFIYSPYIPKDSSGDDLEVCGKLCTKVFYIF